MSYQKLGEALNDSVKMYTPDVLFPRECIIVGINVNKTVKIKINIGEVIYFDEVRYIGKPKINTVALFIPLNNNYDEGYCICYDETTESLIKNVIIDKKSDVTVKEVNDVKDSEEIIIEEDEASLPSESESTINYDKRYAKINHTHDTSVGTLEELKNLIKNTKENSILSLTKNYSNERYANIIISKNIIIEGNGYGINNISFVCDADKIELNDIIFMNVSTNRNSGGALQLNGENIIVNKCVFYNNNINGTTIYEGGAISVNNSSLNTKIINCYFINNYCSNNGGAIRWVGEKGYLLNSYFVSNLSENNGGAIKWVGQKGLIRNCTFESNSSDEGLDIFSTADNLLCIGNLFLNENTVYGTEKIYDYITEFDKKEIEDEIHSNFGRNILYDTQEMIVSMPPNNISYIDEFRKNKVVYFDDESSNENGYRDWYYDIATDEFDYNDEFTFSFWVKSNKENIGKVKIYFNGGIDYIKNKVINSNGYDYSDTFNDGHITFDVNDEWKKCFVTWKLNSTGRKIYKRIIVRMFDGAKIYLSSPKLERGKVSTDWTPNPNDKISNYQIIGRKYIDLNNIWKTGIYRCLTVNEAKSNIGNLPLDFQLGNGIPFVLEVIQIGDYSCKQKITFSNNVKTFEYLRTMQNFNWSQWQMVENQVNCICYTSNITGSSGFGKLLKIKNILPTTNYNATIGFDVYQKNKKFPVRCYLKFKNENIENFNIDSFYYYGENSDIYIINSKDKEWDLYVKKSDDEDVIEIKNLTINDSCTTKENKLEFYPLGQEVNNNDFISIYDETDTHSAKAIKSDYCLDKEQTDGYYLSLNGGNLNGDLNVNGDISSENIITELFASSTDEEIPSAKAVYDSFEQILKKNYNINNTILNKDLYVGKLIKGSVSSSDVTITDNELNFTTTSLYDTYWFIQEDVFTDGDEWDLSFNIRKPTGSYTGKDFGIIIGDENNYIKLFMGYYNIVITLNDETELSKRSGGVSATSDTPIKISRRESNWEFNYNNGEYIANVSTDGYDIPNKFIVQDTNWYRNGSIFINNVVLNSFHKNFSIFDLIYPVGSIYMSVNNINPNVLFGGEWERLKDTFLLASGDTYPADGMDKSTAQHGEATHKLSIEEMPSHNHDLSYRTSVIQTGTSGTWYFDVGTAGTWKENSPSIRASGGSQAHNNMPPYLSVYMWKRVG